MNLHDKEPQFLKKYLGKGFTAFLVIAIGVLLFFAIYRLESILNGIKRISEVLAPITLGFVIAFLLNPIVKVVEKFLTPWFVKLFKKQEKAPKVARCIGIFVAMLLGVTVVAALLNMLIPELYKSIRDLVVTLPEELSDWAKSINERLEGESTTDRILKTVLLETGAAIEKWVQTDLVKWAQNDLLAQTGNLVSSLTMGVINIINAVINILVGIIVSVYLLFSKEKFMNQGRKIVYALCTPRRANFLLHIGRKANEIFSSFIIGKIIDSAIIGVLCFIGLSILKMPYTLLVSVIVGVTNIIPFFGPFIGAVPCAILIFLVDPTKGLYFIIFIFLLQQLDGNIIGPKILGDSTGLSAFWVVFSILVFGGLFGFGGMLIGVPTFALIYYVIKMMLKQKLEFKKLPIETESYTKANYVDETGTFVVVEEKVEEGEKEDADSSAE